MKKAIIVAVVAFTGSNVCAQETEPTEETSTERKNQITLNIAPLFTSGSLRSIYSGRAYLQYRREVKEDFYLKGDLSYRWRPMSEYRSFHFLNPRASDVIQQTDSTRVFMAEVRYMRYYNARIGVEKNIGENDLFTIGASLINGYAKRTDNYAEISQTFDSTYSSPSAARIGGWRNTCSPFSSEDSDNCPVRYSDVHYYSVGASVSAGINLNLTERWAFSLLYEPQFMWFFKVDEDTRTNMPSAALYAYIYEDYGEFRGNIDLLVRYRF